MLFTEETGPKIGKRRTGMRTMTGLPMLLQHVQGDWHERQSAARVKF